MKPSLVITSGLSFALTLAAAADLRGAPPLPPDIRDAGLFVAGSTERIRPELRPFWPQYPLWSDGATKRRWIDLPAGTFIDAGRPDAWEFPRGTRFWKEFSLGRRVETRLIERLADGSWRYATYVWNEAGNDARLAPTEGIPALPVSSAHTGRYAIPSEYDCRACHEGGPVPVLGFSALQLSPLRDPNAVRGEAPGPGAEDLVSLAASGRLRNFPQSLIEKPPRIVAGSPGERAALGYLHANCGHCHGVADESGASVPVGVLLAQQVDNPDGSADVLRSLLGAASRFRPAGLREAQVIVPGQAERSVLVMRMRSRDPRVQMPPLGTAVPDTEGLALIERWINHEVTEIRRDKS